MGDPFLEVVPLGSLIERLEAGVSVRSEDRPACGGEQGVLKVSCVSGAGFRSLENKAVLPSEIARVGPSVAAGDLVLTRANTSDLVALSVAVDRDYPNLHLSDKHWRVILRPEHEGYTWLKHALNSDRVRRELVKRATGTSGSMKNISKRNFLSIVVPWPSAVERAAGGALMDMMEARSSVATRLIDASRRRKCGLMEQLLTGKRRFRPFDRMPWKTHRLGDLFSERVERDRADLPLLSITAGRGVVLRTELDRRDTSPADKAAYLRIAPGDVGYNTMRMWQGVSARSELEGIVSPAYTVCAPGAGIDSRFAAHLFKLPTTVNQFRRHSQGLVDDTLNLKFHHFAQVHVQVPNMDEQAAIASVLDTVGREIGLLEVLRDAYDRQQRAVAELLLTGRVRVPA